jgi:hypothetical protein
LIGRNEKLEEYWTDFWASKNSIGLSKSTFFCCYYHYQNYYPTDPGTKQKKETKAVGMDYTNLINNVINMHHCTMNTLVQKASEWKFRRQNNPSATNEGSTNFFALGM